MKILGLKSVCRRPRKNYVKSTPEITAENKLTREFSSCYFGEKWRTDVTEMKYGNSNRAYLSAILDLADESIVSFVIGHINNNELVYETKVLIVTIYTMQQKYLNSGIIKSPDYVCCPLNCILPSVGIYFKATRYADIKGECKFDSSIKQFFKKAAAIRSKHRPILG